MHTDIEKLKLSLHAAIENGKKLEMLTSMEEWIFFKDVLEKSAEQLTRDVMSGKLNNQRQEDFNRGIVAALRMILDGAENFKTRGENAAKELKRREEQETEDD